MRFTINRETLLAELAFVKGATEQKQTIPALSYLLAEAEADGTVKFTSTDLDVAAFTSTEADVAEAGAVTLPARKLHEIARALPSDEVTFESQGNGRVSITSGKSTFRLAGIPLGSVAEVPRGNPKSVSIPVEVFRDAAAQTSYAIGTQEGRHQQQCLKFILNKSGLRVVSTDGHRLAMFERPELGANVNGTSLDLLIPRKALNLVATFLTLKGETGVGADENHVYFTSGERRLVSRLLVGRFPDYEMVIPRDPQNRVVLDSVGLVEAVKRAALINDHRERPVCLRFTKGAVLVSSEVSDIGAAEESMPAEYDGEEVLVGFTSAYLLDALNSANGGRVSIEFSNPNAQFLIKPVGDDLKKWDVLMPRRLWWEGVR